MNFFDFKIERADGLGFGLFSPGHLGGMLFCAGLLAGLCVGYRRLGAVGRHGMRRAVAFSAVGLELVRALALILGGEYSVGRLPLHLCSLAIYITLLHALRGGELTGQFLYAFCMPGAIAAILLPDWNYYPLFHFMPFCGFTLHALIAGYALMLTCGGELRPELRRTPACLGLMLLMAVPVYLFDLWADTNYMFLNWPPEHTPLAWFRFLGRGFVLGYLPLIAAVWALIYLPFYARGRR